ncbi:hypothetical protein IMG5_197940 [Ichthyophthirius multifiliis]|uniref:asparaginase n=1 Tax=Ichthyophthirius multifiliis TaxID=5932 RepID=G0R5D7_ICHMU|nr:hypothetical protein IMG5_197940 [Ichthyophthirius multifiliis]EGR27326.1 hypothetical protein IMG5_197940 [Ichthyophthirius multifiliis]|eukprot:XP_004024210.1 hypothetical protein IMG5_197940 [Ichthyophthirius multifiliis]
MHQSPEQKNIKTNSKCQISFDCTEQDQVENFPILQLNEDFQQKTQNQKILKKTEDKKVLIINTIINQKQNDLYYKMREIFYFCDLNYTFQNNQNDFLITPKSEYNRRIYYKILQMQRKFEKTFFDKKLIEKLINILEENYLKYDAFIIIHDTNSMTYTGNFISFAFENLRKPIILTGSQVPLNIMRNDQFNNLLGALTIAGHFFIPEVLIYFNNKLFRANRCTKVDSQGLDSYSSPNYCPIAQLKIHIEVNWNAILKIEGDDELVVYKNITKQNIECLQLTPLFDNKMLKRIIDLNQAKGIIIEGYGPGNIPIHDQEFLDIIEQAYEKNIIILIIFQSFSSYYSIHNSDIYDKYKLFYGGDMTFEASLAKLAYLLTKQYNKDIIKAQFQKSLRGEISVNKNELKFEINNANLISSITENINNYNNPQFKTIKSIILPGIACYMAQYGLMYHLYQMKQQNINFRFYDYYKRTALHISAREQKEEVVKFLIKENIDINMQDEAGYSALYEAILTKNKRIVNFLVQNKGEIKADKNQLTNVLFESVINDDLEMIKLFFHSGLKNLNIYTNVDNRNIAHIAACENKWEIIKFLKYVVHFDFSQKDVFNRTPLDDAIYFQNTNIINQLKNIAQ